MENSYKMWPMLAGNENSNVRKDLVTEPILNLLRAKPVIRAEFLQFFEKCYIGESPLFLFAVLEFKGRPTIDEFAKAYDEYIKEGAPNQVNLSNQLRGPLDVFMAAHRSAVGNTEGTHNFPLPVPRTKLDACFAEILHLSNLAICGRAEVHAALKKFLEQNIVDKPVGGKLWATKGA